MHRRPFHTPPRVAAWLLNHLLPDNEWQTPLGDFEEYFHAVTEDRGALAAHAWYWGQVLGLIPRRITNTLYWSTIMLRNYVTVALRSLRKYNAYTAINLAGLAVGMACCLLIYLYVQDELSYDRYHENADRIYRLAVDWETPDRTYPNALTSAPMGPQVLADYPEVQAAVRFFPTGRDVLVRYDEKRFYEPRVFYADASVFDVFSFNVFRGNAATALTAPNTIVLTETMAHKYFGNEDPIGKTVRLDNQWDYQVTGVMQDVPEASHFHFDFLASFSSLEAIMGDGLQQWMNNPYYTYLLLPDGYAAPALEAQFPTMVETYVGEVLQRNNLNWRVWLQPLTAIHLYPLGNEIEGGSSMTSVYLLSAIALFLLLIACINFTNLATARATLRAKEVGVRKVVGAQRGQLVRQFLGESLLLTVFALGLALALVALALPAFNALVDRTLTLSWSGALLGSLAALVLLVGVISGSYPAFFLSSFHPLAMMKGWLGKKTQGASRTRLRSTLVVFQFSISVILMVATLMVYKQLHFMKDKKLGLAPEQVVTVPVRDQSLLAQADALKREMVQLPGVQHVAFSSRKPGTGAAGTSVQRQGAVDDGTIHSMKYMFVDEDFIPTLDITLASGRNFSEDFPTDAEDAVVINAKAAEDLGWANPEEAIGQPILWRGRVNATIVGVVENFHFQPMHVFMQPLVLRLADQGASYMLLRMAAADVTPTLAAMQDAWGSIAPDWPFVYTFLDQDYQALYQTEERFGKIFSVFTFLALFIACLGLLGLATFMVERRTKEMGIRKVLGASGNHIILLLSKDFARLVLIANVIAWPLAYYGLQTWLENYPFRTSITVWVFAIAGGGALLIACLSILYQALRASRSNPVEALRYE